MKEATLIRSYINLTIKENDLMLRGMILMWTYLDPLDDAGARALAHISMHTNTAM